MLLARRTLLEMQGDLLRFQNVLVLQHRILHGIPTGFDDVGVGKASALPGQKRVVEVLGSE